MDVLKVVFPDGSMLKLMLWLLEKLGISVEKLPRSKTLMVGWSWLERIMFQRPQEIGPLVKAGYFDIGIAGEDWLRSCGVKLPILYKIPFGRSGGKVRVVLAVSKASGITCVADLPQKCIVATEYVQLAKSFFRKKGRPDIKILMSMGNTETKILFGATAIIDVTETGSSLEANNLMIIDEVLKESSTVIVANPTVLADPSKRKLVECFVALVRGAMESVKYVRIEANVPEEALEGAVVILGGMKGPTRTLLTRHGWFSLVSYVKKEEVIETIRCLREIGATDIAVLRNIDLMMTD